MTLALGFHGAGTGSSTETRPGWPPVVAVGPSCQVRGRIPFLEPECIGGSRETTGGKRSADRPYTLRQPLEPNDEGGHRRKIRGAARGTA